MYVELTFLDSVYCLLLGNCFNYWHAFCFNFSQFKFLIRYASIEHTNPLFSSISSRGLSCFDILQ